jgi:hypothetical protein
MAPEPLGATSHRSARLGPAFARTDSATVTAASRPLPDTTVTWLLIELTAAVTLRSTARPVRRHSARTRLFTPRHRTRMAP